MRTKFPCLKAFAGMIRFYGGLTAIVAAFISLSSFPHDLAGFIIAILGGIIGAVGLFAFAEFIEMAISVRHDLDDIRFYVSTISKPRPDPGQPTGDSTTQTTDEKSE